MSSMLFEAGARLASGMLGATGGVDGRGCNLDVTVSIRFAAVTAGDGAGFVVTRVFVGVCEGTDVCTVGRATTVVPSVVT